MCIVVLPHDSFVTRPANDFQNVNQPRFLISWAFALGFALRNESGVREVTSRRLTEDGFSILSAIDCTLAGCQQADDAG
jgi:hypothetical protein